MNPSQLLRLTGRKLDAALALLDSGVADAALDEQENQTLARRRTLAADLAALDSDQAQAAKAAAAYGVAVGHRIKAQAALAEAWRLEAASMSESYAARYAADSAVGNIERALIETADSRLGRMLFLLSVIDGNVRAALTFYPMGDPTRPGQRVEFGDNMGDVRSAHRVIADSEKQCTALQNDAIGYSDTTARLGNMCIALAGPLALLEMNPPQLGADGGLEAPLPWGATGSLTRWRVETALPQPRQLEPITNRGG